MSILTELPTFGSTYIVPVAPKLTTRVDCALTSVCRLPVVVNRRSAPPGETDPILIGDNSGGLIVVLWSPINIGSAGDKLAALADRAWFLFVHIDHHPRMIDPNSALQAHTMLETRTLL